MARRSSPPTCSPGASSSRPWALFAAVGDDRRARAVVRADPRRGAVRVSGRRRSRSGSSCVRRRPTGRASSRSRSRPASSRVRDPLAARRPLRRARRSGCSRSAGAPSAMRALARDVDDLGPGRRRRPRSSGAVLAFAAFDGPPLARVGRDDDALEGPHVRVRAWARGAFAIGVGVAPRDRAARGPRGPASRSAREPGVRAFVVVTAGRAVVASAGTRRSRAPISRRRSRASSSSATSIYLAPLAFVATALLLERARPPLWAVRSRTAAVSSRSSSDPDRPRPRQLPVLRGARPVDPRVREPRVVLAARRIETALARAGSRLGACWRRSRWLPLASRPSPLGSRSPDRRRASRLEPHHRDLRVDRRARLLVGASRRTSPSPTTGSTARPATAR